LKLVASRYVVDAIRKADDYGTVTWQDFPEIGEDDWPQVVKLAEAAADKLEADPGLVDEARDLLAAYAEVGER
jgi:hypothetical protein